MASIYDLGDYLVDTFTFGKRSTDKARKQIEEAATDYEKSMQDIAANQKSAKELYQQGRETAAMAANDKAGLAMKNAKAASMQQSGSKLLSAIQGAEAANKATQEGFDTTATQAAGLQAGQEAAKTSALASAAKSKFDAATESAKLGASQAQARNQAEMGLTGALGGAWLQGLAKNKGAK